jgi:hypothetical protein
MARKANSLLIGLEAAKLEFSPPQAGKTLRLLEAIEEQDFDDPLELIRLHEVLLFIRAYPAAKAVLAAAGRLLSTFDRRVKRLESAGSSMSPFERESVSGISGTSVSGPFSYPVVLWLARRYPALVSIDWDSHDRTDRLAALLPDLLPLLSEDSLVEANVPYRDWLSQAVDKEQQLVWLLRRIESIRATERERADFYDSMGFCVRLRLEEPGLTRSNTTLPVTRTFFHKAPLIKRREVSIEQHLAAGDLLFERPPAQDSVRVIEMARAASVIRYRELYGFTHGDPAQVFRAAIGRGAEIYMTGVGPPHRLPLRAYHAGLILKNGVPVGYVETLSLFDRTEIGFNLYYTFRDGESAWLYARVIKLLAQLTGARYFVLDPYQIGFENAEAIDSGAFWFYQKLGFRPTEQRLARLANSEEQKIAVRPGYRSSKRTLQRLAESPMIYEVPGAERGYWDGFNARNIGFAVQRKIAERFGGDPSRMLDEVRRLVAGVIGIDLLALNSHEKKAFDDLALVLSLVRDLEEWSAHEKTETAAIIRAKAAADETGFLTLMSRHARLRDAIRELGIATANE